MARASSRCLKNVFGFLIFLVVARVATSEDRNDPEFYYLEAKESSNVTVDDLPHTRMVLEVRGRNIYPKMRVKLTRTMAQRNAPCKDADFKYNASEIQTDQKWGLFNLTVAHTVKGKIYFCLPHRLRDQPGGLINSNLLVSDLNEWFHQGPDINVELGDLDNTPQNSAPPSRYLDSRIRREGNVTENNKVIKIRGLRLEGTDKESEFDDFGVPVILADSPSMFRVFGDGLVETMTITFTPEQGSFGDPCYLPVVKGFAIENGSLIGTSAQVKMSLPPLKEWDTFYICVKDGPPNSMNPFLHQGIEPWLQVKTYENMMPLWASIVVIIICISFSSLFSGLNLGLMSLDKTELKILCNTGTPKERKYARIIQPVRNHGNYLLCAILLGNVLVNSIFTILLDGLTSGLIAVIFSTLAIVLFGEIFPQAVCSRHGLAVGANTIYITKFVMILTFPLSYSIAKMLDWVLGEEIGNVYTRERLKELVMVTTGENDLDKDEVNIISGALELHKKTVADVMTNIEDVFMLDYEAVLDFETITEIMKSGYSRIPVYEGHRQNIVTMLYIKDLAFVDPDDNTPLKTLCQFYQNPCNFIFEDITLDVMFKIFKEGNKGHMAFVSRVNTEGEGDPFYETIGIITLEDVIEELIQSEIVDETDVITDNRTKRRRKNAEIKDFTVFADKTDKNKVRMSPQLTLAAFQYLSTSVEPFQVNVISETILKRLLKQDIVSHIKKNKDWRTDPSNVIYSQGKAVDYFVIILEGRVEVTVGKENLVFEGGPFTYFGTQALVQTVGIESPAAPSGMGSLESLNIDSLLRHTFIPDYTVRASTEVLYLKIKRSLYLAAKRATLMEKSKRGQNETKEQFDEEIDKLLHAVDDDDISTGRITPRRKSSRNLQNKSQQELISQADAQSPKSHASPPQRLSVRDINGSLKSSPVDDEHIDNKSEEVSLLPKKS
ncbi:hypothetical protein GWI33_010762 [Rhynchophorus ferrugineus]|uniref:Metal transporter CNNM2 n=1 Tax=Rhynchophorus ferrugineus TaxID=354439 RepID=A0A834MK67_RHYFE|nr:hypothetical protein GWI33_010762 [Rhynchophorus ferrugineus]